MVEKWACSSAKQDVVSWIYMYYVLYLFGNLFHEIENNQTPFDNQRLNINNNFTEEGEV